MSNKNANSEAFAPLLTRDILNRSGEEQLNAEKRQLIDLSKMRKNIKERSRPNFKQISSLLNLQTLR